MNEFDCLSLFVGQCRRVLVGSEAKLMVDEPV
jgi:hypothetical protein